MEIQRLALVLIDISGYTRFMKMHTTSLLHAEAIIGELLEAVIDHAEFPLTVSKLEGDAVFLYAVLEQDDEQARPATQAILHQVDSFFDAFKTRERALIACDACRCEACNNISRLKLKAFLHVGLAVIKKIRQFEELGGEDVILIHRLLKNTVPADEYILLTRAFYDLSGGLAQRTPETRTEDCEGIGPVEARVYYPLEQAVPLPPRPAPAPPARGTAAAALSDKVNAYAIGRMRGRIARPAFTHLPAAKLSLLSWLDFYVSGFGGNMLAMIRYRHGKKE